MKSVLITHKRAGRFIISLLYKFDVGRMQEVQENNKMRDITIALAGIFQAAAMVDTLASSGYLSKPEFNTAVNCLLEQNPSCVEATYGSASSLRMGLESLISVLNSLQKESLQLKVRYVLGIIYLQKRLRRKKTILAIIGDRLQQAKTQAKHFEPTHDNVVANLASLYADTISQFRYRIRVKGDPTYLQQQRVANQVRTLLFFGIRSAILWHQVGGRRRQILLSRNEILEQAQQLLRDC